MMMVQYAELGANRHASIASTILSVAACRPPPSLKINFKRLEQGVKDGTKFTLWEGGFRRKPVVGGSISACGRVNSFVPCAPMYES